MISEARRGFAAAVLAATLCLGPAFAAGPAAASVRERVVSSSWPDTPRVVDGWIVVAGEGQSISASSRSRETAMAQAVLDAKARIAVQASQRQVKEWSARSPGIPKEWWRVLAGHIRVELRGLEVVAKRRNGDRAVCLVMVPASGLVVRDEGPEAVLRDVLASGAPTLSEQEAAILRQMAERLHVEIPPE